MLHALVSALSTRLRNDRLGMQVVQSAEKDRLGLVSRWPPAHKRFNASVWPL
jgi:hypothetical protein